jgi:hypothetical protein
MDFADAGGTPYTPSQVVTTIYTLVFHTGMFLEACQEWHRRLAIEQTWANFKKYFAEAHRDLRLTCTTTQGAGYHSANHAMDLFVTDTVDAFANLATVTASDWQLMANLATTNTALTAQLVMKDTKITRLLDRITHNPHGDAHNN